MNPIHILLVKDNEGNILLTGEALVQGKIVETISVVKDQKIAPYTKSALPDFIILDTNLPKMNGQEIFKNIYASVKFKQIPVVIFNTYSKDRGISESYKNNASSFITKRVEVDDFLKPVTLIENFRINTVHLPTSNNHTK